MTQILLVGLVVLLCAAYWLQRLAPSLMIPLWRSLAGVLATTHALPALRSKAEQLATPSGTSPGCGGCKGCDNKNGGCH